MKARTFLVLLILICLRFSHVLAQANDPQDNSNYFDDDGISNARTIVKINVLAIANGDLPLHYERIFGKSFGVEVGLGLLLPYYYPELPRLFTNEGTVDNLGFGHSLWIHPKYYVQGQAPTLNYYGLQFRRRNYSQNDRSIVYKDIVFTYGFQVDLSGRLMLDLSLGLGFQSIKESLLGDSADSTDLVFPIGVKIGMLL